MLHLAIDGQDLRIGERFALTLHRTLRIPDDGRLYPLPAGLGHLPVHRVEDYADRLPAAWRRDSGVFVPLYQREALWLGFRATPWKPNAVQIGVGGVNAVSGQPYPEGLQDDPQNYLVCPDQPWLDGINTESGAVRQFVAMPLGRGYTVEASLKGEEVVGGIQIAVYEPKPGRFPDEPPPVEESEDAHRGPVRSMQPMGLGAGGRMRQKIYPDPYGVEVWDPENCGSVFIHILNSEAFRDVTGREPPATPIDAKTYAQHGLPWFDLYDEAKGDLAAFEELAHAKTISERDQELGASQVDEPVAVEESKVVKLDPGAPNAQRHSTTR